MDMTVYNKHLYTPDCFFLVEAECLCVPRRRHSTGIQALSSFGDEPGPLARGRYEPSRRQRQLRCWRLGGDGLSSPPGLGLERGGWCGGRTLDSRTIPSRTFFLRKCGFRPGGDGSSPPPGPGIGVGVWCIWCFIFNPHEP